MKTFILNLERAHLRRKYMQDQLDRLKLNYEFIKGIDYREMSQKNFDELCGERAHHGDRFIRGVFAASLSHLKICKAIVDQRYAYALVLEDDVILPDNIHDILSNIERFQTGDAVVLLRYYSHKGGALSLTQADSILAGDGFALLPPIEIDQVASAAAYVIPMAVAQAMIGQLYPVDHVPDAWGTFYKKRLFNRLYCLYPEVVTDAPFVPIVEYPATRSLIARLKRNVRRIGVINQVAGMLSRPKTVKITSAITADTPPFWN